MDIIEMSQVNIEGLITEPEEMPLCPLCDQPLLIFEEVVVGLAHGCGALVHLPCCEEGD